MNPTLSVGPAERPSGRQVLAAQLISMLVGLPVALLLVFQLSPFFYLLARAGVAAGLVSFFSSFSTYFLQGAVFGLVQYLLLRAFIPKPAGWVTASGLVAVCLLPALFPITAWLLGGQPSLGQVVSLPGLLLCAMAGGLFGLLLGGVQACWLRAGSIRWLLTSSLAWAGLWTCAFPLIFRSLFP